MRTSALGRRQQPVAEIVPDTQPKFFENNYLRSTSFLRKSLPLIALSGCWTATYAGDRFAVSRMSPHSERVIAAITMAELRGGEAWTSVLLTEGFRPACLRIVEGNSFRIERIGIKRSAYPFDHRPVLWMLRAGDDLQQLGVPMRSATVFGRATTSA